MEYIYTHGYTTNGIPRGSRRPRSYGDEVHGLTAVMGPRTWGHRGDGVNNLGGHHHTTVCRANLIPIFDQTL